MSESKKMSVTQLIIITAVNMMGSGIIMLPAKLARNKLVVKKNKAVCYKKVLNQEMMRRKSHIENLKNEYLRALM